MCREVQAVKLSERNRRQGKARPPSEAVAAVLADPRLLDPLRGGEAGRWVAVVGGRRGELAD